MRGVLAYAVARLRVHPGRALLSAGGIVVVSAMLGAAVTVAASLAGGFDRTAARADLPDVIARFDAAPSSLVAERAGALPNVRSLALRYTAYGVDLQAPDHHVFDATAEGIGPRRRGYAVVAGRDLGGARDEALVERGLARAWHLKPGSAILVGGGILLHVVGVAVEPDTVAFPLVGRPRIFLPYDVALALAGASAGTTNELLLWAGRRSELDVTLSQARAASYGLRNLQLLTRSGIRVEIGQAAGIVVALLVAFALVALVGKLPEHEAGAVVDHLIDERAGVVVQDDVL